MRKGFGDAVFSRDLLKCRYTGRMGLPSPLISPGEALMLLPYENCKLCPCPEHLPLHGTCCSSRGQTLGTACTQQAGFSCSEKVALGLAGVSEKLGFGKITSGRSCTNRSCRQSWQSRNEVQCH